MREQGIMLLSTEEYNMAQYRWSAHSWSSTESVFVSSMLFVNYETMSCNVFELLNVVIGFMIIFGIIFCLNYGTSMCFICKKTYGSISVYVPLVYQIRSRKTSLIDRLFSFDPFRIQN
jgi:hypothetical protein